MIAQNKSPCHFQTKADLFAIKKIRISNKTDNISIDVIDMVYVHTA